MIQFNTYTTILYYANYENNMNNNNMNNSANILMPYNSNKNACIHFLV